MNVLRTKVDMFLEIYLDSWDHKLNEKLLFIIFVYYFGSLWLVWRDSHGLFLSFFLPYFGYSPSYTIITWQSIIKWHKNSIRKKQAHTNTKTVSVSNTQRSFLLGHFYACCVFSLYFPNQIEVTQEWPTNLIKIFHSVVVRLFIYCFWRCSKFVCVLDCVCMAVAGFPWRHSSLSHFRTNTKKWFWKNGQICSTLNQKNH